MCTASWWIGSGRAELCFNRDERKDRPRALPPQARAVGSTLCLWPRDPKSDGTWILANERGLCVFVMNLYGAEASGPAPDAPRSRGELPLRLAEEASTEAATARLGALDLAAYPPCVVGLLDRSRCRALAWNGKRLRELAAPGGFLTTSSFRSAEVQAYRESRYAATVASSPDDSSRRRAFHFETAHPDAAFNPLMRRAESETHSVSLLRIEGARAAFEYWSREADCESWQEPVSMELAIRAGEPV